ncbi:MAG: hypothetical protein WC139_03275 [Candidatus Kapaibacterium sp.]
MARIFPGSVGTAVGKTGKTVFRRTNKKVFSYELTEAFKETKSEKVIANRKNFGKLSKFSNFVNKSETIKKVWKKSKLKGNASNRRILKYNYKTFQNYGISSDINILPAHLYVHNRSIDLNENRLTFKFTTYNIRTGFDERYADFNPPYVFVAVIHAKDPVNPDIKNEFLNVILEESLESEKFSRDEYISYTFDTPEGAFSFINDYNTIIVFPGIVSIDEFNEPIKWAQCGGIYIKGSHPEIITPTKPVPRERPGKKFLIEYS